jgi:aldose 1-epimerase
VVNETVFGYLTNGDLVKKFEMTNQNNMKVEVVSFGASLHSMSLKDRSNNYVNVIVGVDTLEGQFNIKSLFE